MKLCLFYFVLFVFSSSFLIPTSALSQDSSICYLRDASGRVREHNVDFLKMNLNVKFNTKEGKVMGNVKYDFRPIQYVVDTLFLDAPGIDVKKVLLDGKDVTFNKDSAGLTIRFYQPMSWNKQYKLDITYEATPRKGLYFIGWNVDAKNPDNDLYFTRKQIWTQGQGVDNRFWIPVYDDVNDKMITETTITFDSLYTVISNGVLKDKKKNTDGTTTWHYAMSKPMVPYLIMLAIDEFAYKDYKSKNGMVSRQYYYSDRPQTAAPTYQYSAEMMDWLPAQTGVPYPWETYCNVPVQDFMYGAMENTTATVYGDFSLTDARTVLERSYVSTNAHELTHQWFGDYITEYSAQHHWLHESFATYYAKQFLHSVMGEDQYQWAKRGEASQAINADRGDRYPVAHSHGGSARHYPKGSHVIDMLRYVVGDSVYRRCITNYLKKHAYGNVSNHDFQYAFMETAGINLDWFFDQWVYRAGIPAFDVTYERQQDQVAFFVAQTQKVDELTSYFKMPVVFEVYFEDGSSSSKKVWLSHAADTVYVSAPAGQLVDYALFDPAGNVLKTITFKKNFDELSAQLQKAKNMIDRYDALFGLRDIDMEKKRDLLLKVFAKETFNQMRGEVVMQLANDRNTATIELFKRAAHDRDHLVRRAVVDELAEIPESVLPDIENLLADSSYVTIENTLRKLCKLYPAKVTQYLEKVKSVKGINNNVRIAWLEINCREQPASADTAAWHKELVGYTSNRYEFRTRLKAIDAIERLKYADEELIGNLFNACLSPNGRLGNPASRTLKSLLKQESVKSMAQGIYSLNAWKDWEKKIIEAQLK
ncbi:MAG TPA: M1 family metallopeptidase [Chitinophagales bacterium]|nr:M1 family metallopeptidase [Chitinophagales bacterium]